MKTVLAVKIHSFVDLITNSSSELFVCDGNKSLETIKELVLELAKFHNKLGNVTKVPEDATLFESVFKKPYISEYSFNYNQFALPVRTEYEKYNSAYAMKGWNREDDFEKLPLYQALETKEKELQQVINPDETGISKKERDARRKKLWGKSGKLWEPWTKLKVQSEINVFKEFLAYNGKPALEISKIKSKTECGKGRYAWISFPNDKIQKAYDTFSLYMSYNIRTKKGSVILQSAGDNTIPWELMDRVSDCLNAGRWHIG